MTTNLQFSVLFTKFLVIFFHDTVQLAKQADAIRFLPSEAIPDGKRRRSLR